MKNISIIILLVSTLFIGCKKNNFETGIKGTVEFGQGDCMPIIDYDGREYDNFKGEVFFINKEGLDSLGNGDLKQLKEDGISVSIKRGKLSTELPAGTYIVMIKDIYSFSEEYTITINHGEVLKKDFKFWNCTSY